MQHRIDPLHRPTGPSITPTAATEATARIRENGHDQHGDRHDPRGRRSPDWDTAWEAALRDLETHLARVETYLTTNAGPHVDGADDDPADPAIDVLAQTAWTPPPGLGPLPPRFADRARTLLARQEDATGRLHAELSRVSEQRTLLRRISENHHRTSGPVYLDINA